MSMAQKTETRFVTLLMALLLVMSMTFTGAQAASDTIKIATKPMTEQLILGEMLSILIEDRTDLEVKLTKGIGGGTANIHPALLKGDFDMYPEYTGTGWSTVLKKEGIPQSDVLFEILQEEYAAQYGLEWIGLYGFNNTYGLLVRSEIAEEHGLKTYSDLAPLTKDLAFGANYDFFEREDGYDGLCETYGFTFAKRVDLDMGLKYQAINTKKVDVLSASTTDGQISVSDVVMLEDDKGYYQTYYCGTVVRSDTLEAHPELRDVLMLMQDLITDDEMSNLNYLVEGENRDERDVAMEYLQAKGLIPNA